MKSIHFVGSPRMEAMETSQRRAPDEGDASAEYFDEEEEEEGEATKVLKMLENESGGPNVEIPLYEGNLNV